MTVEFLFWEGCPSHPKALADLRETMREAGLDPRDIAIREVHSEAEAATERFVGSPTIRIDGVDIQPVEEEPVGLTCRVYHRRDGRISATPDPADVREALRAAEAEHGANPQNKDPAPRGGSPHPDKDRT
ncbi:MAG TPA: hypothetical protein VNX67_03135 [Solirubrobacteraceae bacterium]|jgi:hypothetical protein|nr:hypothetical protein [Solirubrobacteraceae bacterium]